jgi:streptogramin lyase
VARTPSSVTSFLARPSTTRAARSVVLLLLTALPAGSCFNPRSSSIDGGAGEAGSGCAMSCDPSEHCSSGLCCPEHQENCGGGCVDVWTSLNNCGICHGACPGECAGGQCCFFGCAEAEMCADGMCKSRFTELPLPTPLPTVAVAGSAFITSGPDGNLWLTTSTGMGTAIDRMTPDGTVTAFPLPSGVGAEEIDTSNGAIIFIGADHIVSGPDGNLWFISGARVVPGLNNRFASGDLIAGGDRIGRITPDGDIFLFPVVPGINPVALAVGPDGNLWFTDAPLGAGVPTGADKIGRFTLSGEITEFPLPAHANPQGITAGPDGNLWFVEIEGNAVGRITPTGEIKEFLLPPASRPMDIVAGPDGKLWFTEMGRVASITIAGEITEFSPSQLVDPRSIVTGPDGNLWFVAYMSDVIGRITPAGQITELTIPWNGNVLSLRNIAAGPDGNLWFTCIANQIGRFIPR